MLENQQHGPGDFLESNDGRSQGYDPCEKINNDTYPLSGDHVCLMAKEDFQEFEVEVRVCDQEDGVLAGMHHGVIIGFPLKTGVDFPQGKDPSMIEKRGKFSIGDSVIFYEKQVLHNNFRNVEHYKT